MPYSKKVLIKCINSGTKTIPMVQEGNTVTESSPRLTALIGSKVVNEKNCFNDGIDFSSVARVQ